MYDEDITLDNARSNTEYMITGIQGDELLRGRLLELGITLGTLIMPKYRGGGGEIASYMVRGAHIALRREAARLISVRAVEDRTVFYSGVKGGVSENGSR